MLSMEAVYRTYVRPAASSTVESGAKTIDMIISVEGSLGQPVRPSKGEGGELASGQITAAVSSSMCRKGLWSKAYEPVNMSATVGPLYVGSRGVVPGARTLSLDVARDRLGFEPDVAADLDECDSAFSDRASNPSFSHIEPLSGCWDVEQEALVRHAHAPPSAAR